MKRIIAILIALFVASVCYADGTYTTIIDGKECKIEFVIGPFSPYESGLATLYYNDEIIEKYSYYKIECNSIQIYDVIGLCKFVGTEQNLEAVKPIASFVKH